MDNEPIFNNYKEKQNYYREKYANRGKTIWTSKIVGKDGKVMQAGQTYEKDALAKIIKNKRKNKKEQTK